MKTWTEMSLRERNALVSENVFGYEVRSRPTRVLSVEHSVEGELTSRRLVEVTEPYMADDNTFKVMIGNEGEVDELGERLWYWEDNGHWPEGNGHFVNGGRPSCPRYAYSEKLVPAWAVVEKVRGEISLEVEFSLFANEDGTWEAEFGMEGVAVADTASEAICLAALRAKGVDV